MLNTHHSGNADLASLAPFMNISVALKKGDRFAAVIGGCSNADGIQVAAIDAGLNIAKLNGVTQ